jgi:hypothetical protein
MCDVVKFAPHEPSPSELDHILSLAKDFLTSRMELSVGNEREGDVAETVS